MCHEQWALTVIKRLRFFVLIDVIDNIHSRPISLWLWEKPKAKGLLWLAVIRILGSKMTLYSLFHLKDGPACMQQMPNLAQRSRLLLSFFFSFFLSFFYEVARAPFRYQC